MICPKCGHIMEYQQSEKDVGLVECYFCDDCDMVIYEEDFEEHSNDL